MNPRDNETRPIVYTLTADCRDCYRCVRVCPVKAIRVQDGQAYVDDDRCIQCGTCVRECPQHAKTIRTDTERVREMLAAGRRIAVSVAPSFAGFWPGWKSARLPSALRSLGFGYAAETAEGALVVAKETAVRIRNDPAAAGSIGSACPAVVRYVEQYRPDCTDRLLNIVSPMIAHARMLKHRLGSDWSVVFIGPCAAKKKEALRPEYEGDVAAVLTFGELDTWLSEEGVDLATCPESDFDNPDPIHSGRTLEDARMFALAGGMLKTASIPNDGVRPDVLHVSGAENVMALLDLDPDQWAYRLVEPLFCTEGCINGPGMPHDCNLFERKNRLIQYARNKAERTNDEGTAAAEEPLTGTELDAVFHPGTKTLFPEVPEEQITAVFEQTGKASPDRQLNCGACGYRTCRDNAAAVVLGMAEPEMCIPYMRRLAEQRTDRIIETSPNGIAVLDRDLKILSVNPSFQEMFQCGPAILGRHISYLMDADSYERLASGDTEGGRLESVLNHFGRRFHQILYTLPDSEQLVGIYMRMADNAPLSDHRAELVQQEVVRQANDLLEHQIRMAQEMAGMLGRNTAKSEEMLRDLMRLYDDEGKSV